MSLSSRQWCLLQAVHADILLPLTREVITFGSSKDCTIFIESPKLSDLHCLLMKDPDGVAWLFDCSPSGTRLMDRVLHHSYSRINSGDIFYLTWNEIDDTKRIGFTVQLIIDSSEETNAKFEYSVREPDLNHLSFSKAVNSKSAKNTDADMKISLTCVICGDIFFECCSVQPCLHSFCTVCWLKCKRNDCPICRNPVSTYAKNHQLNDLAELYLQSHPNEAKTDSEKQDLLQQISVLSVKNQRVTEISQSITPRTNCVICSWTPNFNIVSQPNQCSAHDFCACCFRPVPRPINFSSNGSNTVQCEVCLRCFCALVNPVGCSACDGTCLTRIMDLTFPSLPNNLLNLNTVETAFVIDYLNINHISVSEFIQQCLTYFDPSLFSSSHLSLNSPVCKFCAKQILGKLAYKWRLAIPTDRFLSEAVLRPNCKYGRNCRTQRTNTLHARRFNHICEPF